MTDTRTVGSEKRSDMLERIADMIDTKQSLTALATRLFPSDPKIIDRLETEKGKDRDIKEVAISVLQQWTEQTPSAKETYGQELYKALQGICDPRLTLKFKDHLSEKSEPSGSAAVMVEQSQSPFLLREIAESARRPPSENNSFSKLAVHQAPLEQRIIMCGNDSTRRLSAGSEASCSQDINLVDHNSTYGYNSQMTKSALQIFHHDHLSDEEGGRKSDANDYLSLQSAARKQKPNRVIIVGPAGAGKTTLCVKVMQHYSATNMTSTSFLLVLYFDCCNTLVHQVMDIADLIEATTHTADPVKCKQFGTALLASRGKGVLLIFDGLDELRPGNTLVWRIIHSLLLPMATILITSRPCSALSNVTDFAFYELLGLSNGQVATLADRLLGDTLAQNFLRLLDRNPMLCSLVKIPLFAVLACKAFRLDSSCALATITELVNQSVMVLLRCEIAKGFSTDPPEDLDHSSPASVVQLQGPTREKVLKLSEVAYIAVQEQVSVVHDKLLRRVGRELYPDVLKLNFLTRQENSLEENQYCFLHPIIRDFFAAVHLSQTLKTDESVVAAVDDLGTRQCHRYFWCFVAGLIDKRLSANLLLTLGCRLQLDIEKGEIDHTEGIRFCLHCANEASIISDSDSLSDFSRLERVVIEHATTSDVALLSSVLRLHSGVIFDKLRIVWLNFFRQRGGSPGLKAERQLQRQMKSFLEGLKSCSSLEHLVINGPGWRLVDADDFFVLLDIIRNVRLQWLWLTWCKIDDQEVAWLADALKECRSLVYLDLQGNDIGDSGVCALIDTLKDSKLLNQLFMTHNQYGAIARWKLRHLSHVRDLLI